MSNSEVNNFLKKTDKAYFQLWTMMENITFMVIRAWFIKHPKIKSICFPSAFPNSIFPPLFACSDLISVLCSQIRWLTREASQNSPQSKKSPFYIKKLPNFDFFFNHKPLYCDKKNIHCCQYQDHYSENERFYCRVPVKNQVFFCCCCFFLTS